VKNPLEAPVVQSRYALAILAGLVWAASFPPLTIAGFAWLAPALLLAAARGKSGRECFRIGYVAALTYYLATLYWLLLIPYRWRGIPLGPSLGWLSLSGFLALFPATWTWLVTTARNGMAARDSWVRRTLWAISGAAAWVAFEMVLTRVFGGFPWDLLGVSQFRMTPVIQIASVTGVYGVSFLIVWFSLSLVSAGARWLRQPSDRSSWVRELFVPALFVALAFNIGFRQIHHRESPSVTLRVTLVQPSIPQTLIWDSTKNAERFTGLLRLCDEALADQDPTNRTDLLIWPESAIPELLRYETNILTAVTGLARRHHLWMIVAADDAEPHPGSAEPDYFNSSFLISPQGRLEARYVKRNLVIFGEYLPFEHWLPFLKWFTPIQGGFTPGDRAQPFEFAAEDLRVKTSVLICFEDVFPQMGRQSVDSDTSFLVNLTNDGWFGEGAAQWQQAATGLFRAVENRVPLVRCTNTGLTCWIDAYGRIREVFRDNRGSIYGTGFLTFDIPVLGPGETHEQTLYNRYGDWFGWSCVGVAAIMLGGRMFRKLVAGRAAARTHTSPE
jgi:apolipoprotein N-acyltransferase